MTSDGGSLRLDDALKSIIILEKKIDLSVSTRPQFLSRDMRFPTM